MESQTRNRRGSLHPHALPATATEEHSSGHQRTPSRDHRKKALKPASNGEMSDDRLAAPSSDTRRVSDTSSNQEMVRSLTEAVQKAPVKEAMTLVNTMANRQSHDTDGPRRARGHKGILSNLLQLYGAQDGATERLGSKKDDQEEDIIHRNKMNRRRSIVLDMDEELDEVAATKKRKEEEAKAKFLDNKKRRASMMGRRRSVVLDADELVDIVKSKNKPPDKSDKPSGKEIEYEIAAEVAGASFVVFATCVTLPCRPDCTSEHHPQAWQGPHVLWRPQPSSRTPAGRSCSRAQGRCAVRPPSSHAHRQLRRSGGAISERTRALLILVSRHAPRRLTL
jgi:hypothetical protein